jgi:hypothetical protein
MRLGKEQAVGYVEDTEADSVSAEEAMACEADGMPLTTAPEPSLPVT